MPRKLPRLMHDEDAEVSEQAIVPDGHTKWIVGVVGAGLISALAYFATADRASVERDMREQREFKAITVAKDAVQDYQITEQATRSKRIEEKIDLILERLPAKQGRN
jgi:hypothetical protein